MPSVSAANRSFGPAAADRAPPPAGWVARLRQRKAAARLFAERGLGVTLAGVRTAAGVGATSGAGAYLSIEELLYDLLTDHVFALSRAVCAAQEAHSRLPPEMLAERLIEAYLDAVAAGPDAHRAFLFCAHHLPEERRRGLDARLRFIIEMIHAALAEAVPGLAGASDSALRLFPAIRAALANPFHWPMAPEPAARAAEARRLAGMLIAAAEAEAAGSWRRLGRLAGAEPGMPPIDVSSRHVRPQLRVLLDAAEEGAEITITRHGRPVARLGPVG
jgi:prevent-host-death family protein